MNSKSVDRYARNDQYRHVDHLEFRADYCTTPSYYPHTSDKPTYPSFAFITLLLRANSHVKLPAPRFVDSSKFKRKIHYRLRTTRSTA